MVKNNDWQKIYSEYSPKLLGICRRYIQDTHAAEDIIQDSFITAIQNAHQLKDEKMLFAWLKKIVVNNALQHLRKSSKETFITEEPSEIPETSFVMNNNEEKKHVLTYDFTQEELLSSIDSLPHHHKSVFNLYFIENYSHSEIASQLGITVNTSKSHLLRAKKAIQNFLLNTVNAETPKNRKKITQLLIFFGFGGILWAQTFKNKFSDFSISPSKNFEIPDTIPSQNFSIPYNSGFVQRIGIITGSVTVAIITVSAAVIFKPNKSNLSKKMNSDKKTEQKKEEKIYENTNDITLNTEITTKDNIYEKEKIQEEKAIKIKQKEHQIPVKDTAKDDTPQKIIVVKKIIQRDTIYVER
ncbi:hypothetical protein BBI01_00285 [Chryseobacterium artocarpi]|uniref:RNA polymerase sigma factor n=1 Tax=Chryseobacterium artocarpi TaxID=1414727 RepID=A0A1B8ZZ95_9FLAO|nr:sigma-70 family RNA polymerase sigma factor [Chryseobacterium artocarpi]OCA76938.1 hypothetical protein BBI01_00285 [Chryseobacterium artocarpi]